MPLTSLTIKPTLINSTANISVVDLTDYAAAGYTSGGGYIVNGYIKVELASATGVSTVYDNTVTPVSPDIQPLSATNSLLPIPLPQDSSGKPLPGTYAFTYRSVVLDAGFSIVDDFSQSFTYVLDFDYPVACLTVDINCQDSKITSYDETNYGPYSTVSRVHTLYPPPASGTANITNGQAVLSTTNDIYTKTWTQGIASTVSYAFPDGLNLILLLEGTREFDVLCNTGISTIYCCVNKLMRRWNNLRTRNEVAYNNLTNDSIVPTAFALQMYSTSLQSGNEAGADYWYAKILDYSGCAEDGSCNCNDDSPQQVVSVGSSAQFVVDSPDNSIQVVPEVIGGVTTFHIQISAAIQNIISNLFNTTVTTSTPAYIQITQSGVGTNVNYQVDFNPAAIAAAMPFLSIRYEIEVGGGGGNVATAIENVINQGGNMIAPFAAHSVFYGSSPNTNSDIAIIRLTNFIAGGSAVDFTAEANVMGVNISQAQLKNIEAEIWNYNPASITGEVDVRLYDPTTGLAYTIGAVNSIIGAGKLYISLNLTAKP